MNAKTLKRAISEAERFIKIAKSVPLSQRGDYQYIESGKESGAMRRASMDLTRTLADLRLGR